MKKQLAFLLIFALITRYFAEETENVDTTQPDSTDKDEHVITLTEDNFHAVVDDKDIILVEFYAPWWVFVVQWWLYVIQWWVYVVQWWF